MAQGSKPVLVVEDEPDLRSVLKAMLAKVGFEVVVAKDGASALHELWKRGGNVHVMVTDVDMGRMNGMELAESVRSEYPLCRSCLFPVYPWRRRKWRRPLRGQCFSRNRSARQNSLERFRS